MPRFTQESEPLTGREIRKAARAAVSALEENNLDCCLFGSAACAIYGMEREPNDVDIIVLSNKDPEDIKDIIESYDDKFSLVASTNPDNTYRVLWYSLPKRRSCKVDILVPGLISIPRIPVRRIVYQDPFPDIPVLPLLPLLLLKLRGWTDHREDHRRYMREKVPIDEDDILELLSLAVEEYDVHLRSEKWLPAWFVRESKERVEEFVEEFPDSSESWNEIGFSVRK